MTFKQIWDENKHDILAAIHKATPQTDRAKKKKGLSLVDLANLAGLSPRDAKDFVEYMKKRGANIYTKNSRILTKQILPVTRYTHEDVIKQKRVEVFGIGTKGYQFGVISDTHFGSNRTNIEVLHSAYQYFEDEKITDVFHLGNILAGKPPKAYRTADNFVSGLEEQIELFEKEYPRHKKITTHFILGHTDRTHQKEHTNPAMEIVEARQDFNYLGIIEADIVLNPIGKKPFRIRLYNEKLRFYYATSYQPQKIVENLSGGDKPDIWLTGGSHQVWDCRYQSVDISKVAGLQHQTLHMRDRAYRCNVGFYISTVIPTGKRPQLYTHCLPDMWLGPDPGQSNAQERRKAA